MSQTPKGADCRLKAELSESLEDHLETILELQKSNSSKIEISGSQAKDVSVNNSNGTLKIRLKFPKGFVAENIKIVLLY